MFISIAERTSVERKRWMFCTPVRSVCAERLSSSSICLIIVSIIFVVNGDVDSAPKHLDIFQGAPLRLPKPLSDQFPVRVCSCSLCIIHRL